MDIELYYHPRGSQDDMRIRTVITNVTPTPHMNRTDRWYELSNDSKVFCANYAPAQSPEGPQTGQHYEEIVDHVRNWKKMYYVDEQNITRRGILIPDLAFGTWINKYSTENMVEIPDWLTFKNFEMPQI